MPKTAACSEEKQFLCPEMKIWGTCSKCTTGTQVHGQGIRKGLYTCPHSLTAGFMLWSNGSSSRGDWVEEGVRGMELPDIAKWLRQTQIWHSHELLCSVNATRSSCPGPQPCCTTLWNEECFKGSCTHKDFLQKQICTGSHHRNYMGVYLQEWKLVKNLETFVWYFLYTLGKQTSNPDQLYRLPCLE